MTQIGLILSCLNLKGAAEGLCRLKEGMAKENTIDVVWACVEDQFVKDGGKKEDLKKIANIGFIVDPIGRNKFVDDKASLEPQEKLNFAYHHPQYYHCIAKSKLPIPFAMNDFNPNTEFDDKLRMEINKEVDSSKVKINDMFETLSSLSTKIDMTREEALTKQIFNETLKKAVFYSDCEIECTDYEALKYKQGACTESSALLFYKYKYAGLAPSFVYWHDVKPSLEWIDILTHLGGAQDHVFIGVPEKRKGPQDKQLTHVDLINNKYDAQYGFPIELSESSFVSLWLLNRILDLNKHGKYDEIEKSLSDLFTLAPGSLIGFQVAAEYYGGQKRRAEFKYINSHIKDNFKDHPWTRVIAPLNEMKYGQLNEEQKEAKKKEIDKGMQEIVEANPYLAAQLYAFLAGSEMGDFIAKINNGKQAAKNGAAVNDQFLEAFHNQKRNIIINIVNSLTLDPNYMFAYRDLEFMLDQTSLHQAGVQLYNGLLNKHPGHTPFMYALAGHLFKASIEAGIETKLRGQFLQQSVDMYNKITKLEPDSSRPYITMAKSYANMGNHTAALSSIEMANKIFKKGNNPIPMNSYLMSVMSNLVLGNKSEIKDLLEEVNKVHGMEAVKNIAENFLNMSSWFLKADPEEPISDKEEEIPMLLESSLYFGGIFALCEQLDKYGSAKEYNQLIKAKFVPVMFAAYRLDAVRKWILAISTAPSDKLADTLAENMQKLIVFLAQTNAPIKSFDLKEAEEFVSLVEPILKTKHPESAHALRTVMVWRYILRGDKDGAGALINTFTQKHFMEATAFCLGKLTRFGKGSAVATDRIYKLMDLLWEKRDLLSKPDKMKTSWHFDELAKQCDSNNLPKEAAVARSRAEELRK